MSDTLSGCAAGEHVPGRPLAAWTGICIMLLCIVSMACELFAAEACAKPGPAPQRFRPTFPVTGMVALAEDGILLWHQDGRAQRYTEVEGWSAVERLPIGEVPELPTGLPVRRQGILKIVPDLQGMLVLEALSKEDLYNVLLIDRHLQVLARWELSDVLDLRSGESGRSIVLRAGLRPLLPGGALGPLQPFPSTLASPRAWPVYVQLKHSTAMCVNANLTQLNASPLRCQALAPLEWQFEGGQVMAEPPGCQSWLLVWEGAELRQLQVRDDRTGQLHTSQLFPQKPVLACASEGGIWTAGTRVELRSLPSLKPRWRGPREPGPISDLVVTARAIVYAVGEPLEVVLLPRTKQTDK